MSWKQFGLVAITYDQDKEDVSSIQVGPFTLGPGSEKIPEAATVITGEKALTFLARLDAFASWHWIPPWLIRAVRSHATKPIKIGCVAAFEAVSTVGFWSLLQAPLFAVSEAFVLKGTDGKPVTNGPITWINVAAPGYAEAYVNAIDRIFEQEYKQDRPDLVFYDSMIGRPYYGNVPNAPPITVSHVNRYTGGWARLLREHQGRINPVWGNINIYSPRYRELVNNFLEHAVTGNADVDAVGIAKAAAHGRTVIGWEGQPPSQDYWSALQKALAKARNDRIYLCTARTGKNFAITVPEGVV